MVRQKVPTRTTFSFLVNEGREDPNTMKRATIGPPAIRHMAFRWQTDNGQTLNAGLVAL